MYCTCGMYFGRLAGLLKMDYSKRIIFPYHPPCDDQPVTCENHKAECQRCCNTINITFTQEGQRKGINWTWGKSWGIRRYVKAHSSGQVADQGTFFLLRLLVWPIITEVVKTIPRPKAARPPIAVEPNKGLIKPAPVPNPPGLPLTQPLCLS